MQHFLSSVSQGMLERMYASILIIKCGLLPSRIRQPHYSLLPRKRSQTLEYFSRFVDCFLNSRSKSDIKGKATVVVHSISLICTLKNVYEVNMIDQYIFSCLCRMKKTKEKISKKMERYSMFCSLGNSL